MEMTFKKTLLWSWNSPTHSSSTSQPSKHRGAEHHEGWPCQVLSLGVGGSLERGPGVNVLVTAIQTHRDSDFKF